MNEGVLKGGRCSQLAARFGQDETFRAWYDLRKGQTVGTATENDIKLFFYRACQVNSRAVIDHNDYARRMFHKIRNEFLADQRGANRFQKHQNLPWRCQGYTDWVKTLPCIVSGHPADDPHHLVGHKQGAMASKVSDLWTMPMTRQEHGKFHDMGWQSWEKQYGSQWMHVCRTIERAVKEGVLVFEG